MGLTLTWLSVIILIPLAGLFLKTLDLSFDQFWGIITSRRTLNALKISFGLSFAAACVNLVMGMIVVWALVRYKFPGRRLFDAIVDKVADKKGTQSVAEAYLKYWYTKEGQEIAARNSYRPRDSEIAKEYEKSFAKVELFTIDNVFGGWTKAQKEHFGEGGIFDQIYKN